MQEVPFNTLIDATSMWADRQPDALFCRYLHNGESVSGQRTFSEVALRARSIAANLTAAGLEPGDRALILMLPGIEFAELFLGCVHAGVVTVPVSPPAPHRPQAFLERFGKIIRDAGARAVLTQPELIQQIDSLLPEHSPIFATVRFIDRNTLVQPEHQDWQAPKVKPNHPVLLQYTSGSTAEPKGVILNHAHILANVRLQRSILGAGRIVTWLPAFHDMGLTTVLFFPLLMGSETVVMSPLDFLQKPFRWLKAISDFTARIAGGPNFGYELCTRKISQHEIESLDLSAWKTAFCGAEPISPSTAERFCERFAACGFSRSSFLPVYGLAEATLAVSGIRDRDDEFAVFDADPTELEQHRLAPCPAHHSPRRIVGCGGWGDYFEISIVDPTRQIQLGNDEIGEIWVKGASVGDGYWGKDEASEVVFQARTRDGAGPFLRTGDLGFIREGQLFVTGRLKDLIIIDGRNIYPQDVENVVEAQCPNIRRGCSAALALDSDKGEQLCVVAEVERRFGEQKNMPHPRRRLPVEPGNDPYKMARFDPAQLVVEMRRAVADVFSVRLSKVLLVKAGSIVKTTSGKISRAGTRAALMHEQLAVVYSG